MEEWKVIPGTNEKILISTKGNVKSLLNGERLLTQQYNQKGYRIVRVTINRIKITIRVHREVAKAFIPCSDYALQVNHKDGNKSNNSVENLEWVTNQENADHAIRNGLWKNVFLASTNTNEARKKIIKAINNETKEELIFNSISDAERQLNTRHITDVLKGKRTQTKGYAFEYLVKGGDACVC